MQTEKEKAEVLADAFEYPPPPEVSNSKVHRVGQQPKSLPYQDDLLKPFTKDELNTAIQNLKTPSRPGIDKVDNLWLIKRPEEFRTRILMVFNWCWLNSTFPQIWKPTIIKAVPQNAEAEQQL